jgi:hypothetical protein
MSEFMATLTNKTLSQPAPTHSVLWFEDYLRFHSHKPGKLLHLGGQDRNDIYMSSLGFQVTNADRIPSETFDYAMDIFNFKQIIDEAEIQNYLNQLKHSLKKGGIYHLSLTGLQDGYFGPLLAASPNPRRLVTDPHTQESSILYSRKDIENLFKGFQLLEFMEKKNLAPLHGQIFTRSVLSFIFIS